MAVYMDIGGARTKVTAYKDIDGVRTRISSAAPIVENFDNYLTFSSSSAFTIATENTKKNWDGTLYYSTDAATWSEWDGVTAIASAEHNSEQRIYMCGSGNSVISGEAGYDSFSDTTYPKGFKISGAYIRCDGNIESLLDKEMVAKGEHPVMGQYCFSYLFYTCHLTTAPELPATTLSNSCYRYMFCGCPALTVAPDLPATNLAENCYTAMFLGCDVLTVIPKLPATKLEKGCYSAMFRDCGALTTVTELPATTLEEKCYYFMFRDCLNLKVSATQTDEYTSAYRIPTSGTGTTATDALTDMFYRTGGTFTGTPEINTTYYIASKPIAYLYNDVQLPPLPERDETTYPYALINRYTVNNITHYELFFSCKPVDDLGNDRYIPGGYIRYYYKEGEGEDEWTYKETTVNTIIFTASDEIWKTGDPDPVPVYA